MWKKFSLPWGKEILSEKYYARIAREMEKEMVWTKISLFLETLIGLSLQILILKYFMSYSQVAYWKESVAFFPLQRNSVQHPTHNWETKEAVLQKRSWDLSLHRKCCAKLFVILVHKLGRLWCVLRRTRTVDITKTMVLQVMGRPLSICVRNTAWRIQQADAEYCWGSNNFSLG